jgi:outer membrane protein OmpA-like peptidoglycan-associated protein
MRLCLLLAVHLPLPALAQDQGGFDAHGFDLTAQDGDVRDHYTVHRPGVLNAQEWFAGGVIEYANRPLVLVTEQSDETLTTTNALNHVMALNLTGGATPHERIRLTASVPLYFTSTGFDGGQGAALGDLRLDALVSIIAPNDGGFGVGVVPWLDLPTGATRKFLGRRTVAGGALAAGTYEADKLTFTGNLGVQLDPKIDLENLTGADSLIAGLGAGYMLDDVSNLGLEARLLAPFSKNDRAGTGSPAEAILSYRRRLDSGAFFSGGLAAPLSAGAGAAAWRLFVGGGFGKIGPAAPKDLDMDGITDDLDACPEQPETVNTYIDEDGCPDELGTLRAKVTFNGDVVSGADLSVTGPGVEEKVVTGADPWRKDVLPETMWMLQARKGDCLAGEVKKLVGAGINDAEVQLRLVPSATVSIWVHDTAGNAVPGAKLMWDSATPECLPEVPQLANNGKAKADIGAGTHKLVVGAPGYRVVEVPILASPGEELPVEVVLTPTKLRVEAKRIVILEKVQFEFNKAVIKPESFELLNEVADVILRNPQAGRVEVQGHTDDKGSDKYNLDLSQRRSESVREYLIGRGVPRDRLLAVGYGESVPLVPNTTEPNRATNRRVEFLLIDQQQQQIEEKAPPPQ